VKALRLLLCLGLAACADLETKPWFKVDGNAASPEQLEVDRTACREEMQRSVASTNQAAALDRGVVKLDAYDGCMARLGYSDSKRFSPPPAVQGSPPPQVVQGGLPPPGAKGSLPPPGAQGASAPTAVPSAPPPSDQDCRKPTDLRMWLPLCP
jgi:hypothetical protein